MRLLLSLLFGITFLTTPLLVCAQTRGPSPQVKATGVNQDEHQTMYQVTCSLTYDNLTSAIPPRGTAISRVCSFLIRFSLDENNHKWMAWSCEIRAGESECSDMIYPSENQIHDSWVPTLVKVDSMRSDVEEQLGCTNSPTSPNGEVLDLVGNPPTNRHAIDVNHEFFCAHFPGGLP